MNYKKIVNFIFELNQLKKEKHNGWFLCGVNSPDTVAEHAFRAAQIGYILAESEGGNPEKVTTMLIIHDNAEARIGDKHKVSSRYISTKKAEVNAFSDQLNNLNKSTSKKFLKYFQEYEERSTLDGIIAKDADWLEQAFQAKEYYDLGYKSAIDWINNVEKALETKTAKLIIKELKKNNFTDWWSGLKKMTYKKINYNK